MNAFLCSIKSRNLKDFSVTKLIAGENLWPYLVTSFKEQRLECNLSRLIHLSIHGR